MRENKFHTTLTDLYDIKNNLSSATTLSTEILFKNVARLERTLMDNVYTETQKQEIIDLFRSSIHKYEQHFTDYTAALEKKFTDHTITTGKIDYDFLQESIWYYKFEDLVKQEIELASIDERSKVLFIGSGPFPLSPILYQKHAQCQVVGIEKEAEYAETSRALIQALGLTDSITIKTGLGEEFTNDSYTHVIAGLQALPKNAIFEQISNQMPSGTTTVCRVKSGFGNIYYDTFTDEEFNETYFEIVQRVENSEMVIIPIILNVK